MVIQTSTAHMLWDQMVGFRKTLGSDSFNKYMYAPETCNIATLKDDEQNKTVGNMDIWGRSTVNTIYTTLLVHFSTSFWIVFLAEGEPRINNRQWLYRRGEAMPKHAQRPWWVSPRHFLAMAQEPHGQFHLGQPEGSVGTALDLEAELAEAENASVSLTLLGAKAEETSARFSCNWFWIEELLSSPLHIQPRSINRYPHKQSC